MTQDMASGRIVSERAAYRVAAETASAFGLRAPCLAFRVTKLAKICLCEIPRSPVKAGNKSCCSHGASIPFSPLPDRIAMKLNRRLTAATTLALAVGLAESGHGSTTAHALSGGNFSQNWSNVALITTNDNWSGVPSIVGYLGDDGTGSVTAVDPQTLLLPTYSATVDVIANQTNPNTNTTGGVAEFDTIADPVVALQGSGTADAPNLVIYLDSTGMENVRVQYNLRDIDGSADNAVQPVALQYRVGGAGDFINVPGAFVSDVTTGPSLATAVSGIDIILPSGANNAADLQLRIMTTNAASNDEWVGIDDIQISATAIPEPGTIAFALAGFALMVRRRR